MSAAEARAFVDDIRAAGGELTLGDLGSARRARYRRLLSAAQYHHVVPDGQRLRYTGRDSGEMTIRLVPDTPENAPLKPVPPAVAVPSELPRRPHPFVAATKQHAKDRGKRSGRDGD